MDPDAPLTVSDPSGAPDAPPSAASGVIQPSRPVIVEVLDARGLGVRARVRLDRFPATVGRAYSSDVILDDPYADARHLRLDWDPARGAVVAEDLGSVNGTSELLPAGGGDRAVTRRTALRPGAELRVGRTVLRFCDPDQPVPAALPDRHRAEAVAAAASGTWLPWGPRLSPASVPAALGICLTALALFGVSSYLASTERTNLARIVSGTLWMLVPFAAWAGAWALGSRMVIHRFNFLAHLATACAAAVAYTAVAAAGEWLDFYFPGGTPSAVLGTALLFPLAAALVAGHLRYATHFPRARRWRAAAAVTLAVTAVAALDAYADRDDWSSGLEFSSSLKPAGASVVPALPLERFGTETAGMKEELEEIASTMEKEK